MPFEVTITSQDGEYSASVPCPATSVSELSPFLELLEGEWVAWEAARWPDADDFDPTDWRCWYEGCDVTAKDLDTGKIFAEIDGGEWEEL